MEEKKKKKKGWTILVIIAVAFLFLQLWQLRAPSVEMELKGETLDVWVAANGYLKRKGLGKKDGLGDHDGMMFLYTDYNKHIIVMRDMEFPIDIVWFNDGKVIDIAPNIQPEDVPEAQLTKYYPRQEANVILELSAGWAESHDLKIGDKLTRVDD